MLARLPLAVVALALFGAFSGPPDALTNPMLRPVRGVVTALETNKPESLAGIYTQDAVVVADIAPFSWSGEGAGAAWLASFRAEGGRLQSYGKMADLKASAQPVSRIQLSGQLAYVTVPVVITGAIGKRHYQGPATITFALRRSGSQWKVFRQTWIAESFTSGRYSIDRF